MEKLNDTILDAFRFRYACKNFDETKIVSKDDFDTILETAHLSPSSFGFEPWKLIILQNRELRAKLSKIAWGAQRSLDGASHFVILLARKKIDTVHTSDYLNHIMKDVQHLPENIISQKAEAFYNFQNNDFNLLESDRAIFDWASKQTYIALANMLTTAALLSIDSCPIEGFNIKAVNEFLEEENLVDTTHFGVSVMAGFGYRKETPHFKTRQPLEDIVIWK